MFRPSVVTDEMLAEIRRLAGKVPAKEIARRLGIPKSLLVNRAAKYRISLRANRTVFTPATVAKIMALVGKIDGRSIAQQMGLKYRSLCHWAGDHGVRLRVQSNTFIARYARLKSMAQAAGFRFSWRPPAGISLWVSVAEDMTPEQAEAFLKTSGVVRHDVAAEAYDKALDGRPHSCGAAAFPWDSYEQLRVGLAPKITGMIPPTPELSGCASRF